MARGTVRHGCENCRSPNQLGGTQARNVVPDWLRAAISPAQSITHCLEQAVLCEEASLLSISLLPLVAPEDQQISLQKPAQATLCVHLQVHACRPENNLECVPGVQQLDRAPGQSVGPPVSVYWYSILHPTPPHPMLELQTHSTYWAWFLHGAEDLNLGPPFPN